ncbi:MAG: DUF3604 domain-containing protein [Candidatus Sulfotelmatobacter sp.]
MPNPPRNAYFGDVHVHTSYSLDAYSFGNRNDPRAAYHYGRGEAVTLPGGIQSQLRTPVDFIRRIELYLCAKSNASDEVRYFSHFSFPVNSFTTWLRFQASICSRASFTSFANRRANS